MICFGLAACGGGGGGGGGSSSNVPDNGNFIAFTADQISAKTLIQSVPPTENRTFVFNADKTVKVSSSLDGNTAVTSGTWLLNSNGTVTVTLPDDTITMYLVINMTSYLVVTNHHTKGSLFEPIVLLNYVTSVTPAGGFTLDRLSGKPLQQAVSASTSKTFDFDVFANTVLIVTNQNGSVSEESGTWVLNEDGTITVSTPSEESLKLTLVSTGATSMVVNILHTNNAAENGVTLNNLSIFTAALMTEHPSFYVGYYSPASPRWRGMVFGSESLFNFTNWSSSSTVDISTQVALMGGWDINSDSATLNIAAATTNMDFSNSYLIIGVDPVNEYWLVYSRKGPLSTSINSVPAVERWYYGETAAAKVASFIATGN